MGLCHVNGGKLLKVLQAFRTLHIVDLTTIHNKLLQFVMNSKDILIVKSS